MPRRYQKKSSFETEEAYKEYLNYHNRRREKLSRRNKGRKERGYHPFPYLLPFWGKWTADSYRLMVRQLGYTMEYTYSIGLLSEGAVRNWGIVSTWKLSPEIDQRITNFAEQNGYWHMYPFPPKVSLILAREAKHAHQMAIFLRVKPAEIRWIQSPYQLLDYRYDQVNWVILGNQKHMRGMEKHPFVNRWIRKCEEEQEREVTLKIGLGAKRSLPKV